MVWLALLLLGVGTAQAGPREERRLAEACRQYMTTQTDARGRKLSEEKLDEARVICAGVKWQYAAPKNQWPAD